MSRCTVQIFDVIFLAAAEYTDMLPGDRRRRDMHFTLGIASDIDLGAVQFDAVALAINPDDVKVGADPYPGLLEDGFA